VNARYNAETTSLIQGRVLHFRLACGDRQLAWSDVIRMWQDAESFRRFFVATLQNVPFSAFFWETPPVTELTTHKNFEFVIVEAKQLVGVPPDHQAFASYFTPANSGSSVVEFPNLGGDASLIVPCPAGPLSAYSHIASFTREAPDAQQHQLWKMVGAALERNLGTQPVWLNTSGAGIHWLHIRLDSTPKYYTYNPYRAP